MHYLLRFLLFTLVISLLAGITVSCSDDSDSVTPNSFTPEDMVFISSTNATFQMGSESGLWDEVPVHTVSFTYSFWMDETEVTQADYATVMAEAYTDYASPNWLAPHGVGDEYPAYAISWSDAVLYCNARSQRDNLDPVYTYSSITGEPGNFCELVDPVCDMTKSGYRLPTEAEWEFACRAGTTTDFYWGKDCDPYPATSADSTELSTYAIWYGNSFIFGSDNSSFGTQPVGQTTPNEYGLYDMAGNVFEYCNDWYGEYSADDVTDPTGPETGDFHSMRGGSWGNNAFNLRASNRTVIAPDYIYYFIGFRVVLPE